MTGALYKSILSFFCVHNFEETWFTNRQFWEKDATEDLRTFSALVKAPSAWRWFLDDLTFWTKSCSKHVKSTKHWLAQKVKTGQRLKEKG